MTEEWVFLLRKYTSEKSYSKNEMIFKEGDIFDGMYFINSGKVKIITSSGGDERLLRLSASGDLMGHRALSSANYPISAIALADCTVTFIPASTFKNVVMKNPDFAMYLIDFLAEELKKSEELMKSMIHNDIIIRIAKIICMLIDAFGYEDKSSKKLAFSLSRSDIANFAGSSYESVIRNLARLEEMGLIKMEKKTYIIPNEKELRLFVKAH